MAAPGEMMFKAKDRGRAIMLRGAYVTDEEIEAFLGELQNSDESLDMLKIRGSESIGAIYIGDNATDSKAKKELAGIIYWILGYKTISMNKIREEFNMGNRVTDIMKTLEELHIVTEQFAKQPRKVIPVCTEDLLPEVVNLLEQCGYAMENIEDIFRNRAEQK